MAEQTDMTKMLFSVELQAENAISEMQKLHDQILELQTSQTNLRKNGEENSKQYIQQAAELKNLQAAYQNQQRVLQKAIDQGNEYGDSLDEMKRKVSNLTKEYNTLSKADREGDYGKNLAAQIKSATDELSACEQACGNFHRQVGNYKVATEGLAESFKAAGLGGTALGKGIDFVDKTGKMFAKNPIMGVVQLLLPLIMRIVTALKDNQSVMDAMHKIMNKLHAAFAKFEPLISKVAGLLQNILLKAFDVVMAAMQKVLGWVDKLAKKFGKDLHLADAFNEGGAAAEEMAADVEDTSAAVDELAKREAEAAKQAEEFARQRKALRDKYGLISDEEKLAEEEAALQDALDKGLLTQEEYNKIHEEKEAQRIADEQALRDKEAADKAAQEEKEAAQRQKEQDEATKAAEKAASDRRSILDKYGLISDKQKLKEELTDLQDALDKGLLSEEEYAQAVATIYSEIALAKGQAVTDFASGVLDMVGQIGDAVAERDQAEMDRYIEQNEEKKAALEERLASGMMTQEDYDQQVAALDAEQAKKQKELDMKNAKRQKAMAIMNATVNAAGAIIASLAQSPVAIGPIPNPVGIASLALATATGAMQTGIAAATPLPQAARGALLEGPSHAHGGVPIEAEGGESVINKNSTRRYRKLLSAINVAGGGRKFAFGGVVDGGYLNRSLQAADDLINYDRLADACGHIRPQVAVEDINRGQRSLAEVESLRTM